MLKSVIRVRAAAALLNPDKVRRLVSRTPDIGLVASGSAAYADMEDFLIPAAVPHERRVELMRCVHRAGDPEVPPSFDIVLYEAGLPCPPDAFPFYPEDTAHTVARVLADRDELGVPLARHFLPFRKPAVDRIVHSVARENALFAVATALPGFVPTLLGLPFAVGEFATDTAFITLNQVRMAFLIAAAMNRDVGFSEQRVEIGSIAGSALGWRTIARELAGLIPFGGGIIPKGAIAYAGTYVMGKGIERLHNSGRALTAAERDAAYRDGLARGRAIVEGAAPAAGTATD